MSSVIPAPVIPLITSVDGTTGLSVSSGSLALAPAAAPSSPGAMLPGEQEVVGPLTVQDGLRQSTGLGTPGITLVSTYTKGRVNNFCHKVAVDYTAFTGSGDVGVTATLWDFDSPLGEFYKIERVIAVINTPFAGTPTDLFCEVGVGGDTDCFLESFSCYTAPSKGLTLADSGVAIAGGDFTLEQGVTMVAKFDVVGFSLGDLTNGNMTFFIEGKVYS